MLHLTACAFQNDTGPCSRYPLKPLIEGRAVSKPRHRNFTDRARLTRRAIQPKAERPSEGFRRGTNTRNSASDPAGAPPRHGRIRPHCCADRKHVGDGTTDRRRIDGQRPVRRSEPVCLNDNATLPHASRAYRRRFPRSMSSMSSLIGSRVPRLQAAASGSLFMSDAASRT